MWSPVIILLMTVLRASTQHVRYVKPNDSLPPNCLEPCLTLDQYTQQATTYFTTGSTFVFLAGNHTALNTVNLTNISDITLKGEEYDPYVNNVIIVCRNDILILCEKVTNLIIEGLKFLLNFKVNGEVSVLKILHSANILINCTVFKGSDGPSESFARAISITDSTLTVISCLFEGNAGGDGGAIYAIDSNITLNNSVFISNRANRNGGAIFSQDCILTLNGNIFVSNRAKFSGGAISARQTSIYINGVSNNDMPQNLSATIERPGYCNSSMINLILCMIGNNDCHAILNSYRESIASIDDTLFTPGIACFSNNEAHTDGGAIFTLNSKLTFGGTVVVFRNNSASYEGGALKLRKNFIESLYVPHVVMKAYHIYFIGNRAKDCGGAISVWHISIFMGQGESMNSKFNLHFIDNYGTVHGGAIYSRDCTIKILGNSYFLENSASKFGGAICITRGSRGIILLASSAFFKNEATYGGAIMLEHSNAEISGNFSENVAVDGGAIYILGLQTVHVTTANFGGNTARRRGGGIFVSSSSQEGRGEYKTISANFTNNTADSGGAVYVEKANIIFKNIFAMGNSKSALYIFKENRVEFSGTTNISKNTGKLGGGIAIIWPKNYVSFTGHTVFDSNRASSGGAIYSFFETTLAFSTSINFSYNTADTDGGAIYALRTNITFTAWSNITLNCNSAQNGGAVYLDSASSLTLNQGTTLSTSNNHAFKYGGVIYHEDTTIPTQCNFDELDSADIVRLPYCFIKFEVHKTYFSGVTVNSRNDSSGKDGSFMYGGLLDRCQIEIKDVYQFESTVPYKLLTGNVIGEKFDSIIHAITSRPYQLCFCKNDQNFNCSGVESIEIHRGQTFSLSLLAIDQLRNSTPTQITAKIHPTARLKLNQSSQTLLQNCSNLYYAIYSTRHIEELVLYPDGPCRDTGLARAVINVTLLPCPDGFTQSGEQCVCEERLQQYDADCIINEGIYIVRKTGLKFWINAMYINESYQGLIRYKTCPADYCKIITLNLTFDNPDIQCANNRSGVLCGACAVNYSLLFGSSRCKECSNTYLALVLPFAAAGIALVVFLSILQLTVATGMINSVILYANIIQVNRNAFFLTSRRNILTVFIAWLNLDLGIETCFYNGMTAYSQTWLQFAFPIYVWILIGLIIVASRYSMTLSKLIGHNPVAVLATLMLMSYTKILKIIIEVYSSVDLDYPDNKTVTVWLKDASVPYLRSAEHLLLTVVTSLVLVFLFLPYTLLLLQGYKVYCFSGTKYFHWLNRLKPLLDSYYAPYKIHTHYWTGFMLLVRWALYVIFSLVATNKSLLAIVITFSLLGLNN